MPTALTDIVTTLKARLDELDVERAQIAALLLTYGESVSPWGATAPVHGMPASYMAPVFPPVPESEKIHLKKDSNGRTGISSVIVDVTRKHPGLDITQLANRIYDYIDGDVPSSRDGMRSMIKYAVVTGRLAKRAGRYYAAEQPSG